MKRICLDPGHYRNNGARKGTLIEDVWALAFAERLGHYVRAAGGQTVFTRTSSLPVSLKDRGRVAKREGCDGFVSIHLNAAGSSQARGCEAFYAAPDGSKGPGAELGRMILHTINGITGMPIRGVKPDNASQHSSLTVLRTTYNAMPAVLVEVGFISNPTDAAILQDKRLMETLAQVLGRKLVEWMPQPPTK